jgi:hypothetical protein
VTVGEVHVSPTDHVVDSDSGSVPEDDELRLARPQGSDSGSALEDDELRLARPQGSDSALASAYGVHLARPKA